MYEAKLEYIDKKYKEYNSQYDNLVGQYNHAKSEYDHDCELEGKYKVDIALYKKSAAVMAIVQEITKEKAKITFEKLVTYAMRFICQEEFDFEIEFGKRGNLPEANFKIKTADFKDYHDIKNTNSGGIINILALAMRIVLLELKRPRIEGPLILDESFTNLSEGYLARASEFLNVICDKIGRQIIMVTHKKEFIENEVNLIKIGGQ